MVRLLFLVSVLLCMAVCSTSLVCSKAEPSVSTKDATEVTSVSATLNGFLNGLGDASSVDVFFRWGTGSGYYPNVTPKQTMTSTGGFSCVIFGMIPGTTYYFLAEADGNGSAQGESKVFYVG